MAKDGVKGKARRGARARHRNRGATAAAVIIAVNHNRNAARVRARARAWVRAQARLQPPLSLLPPSLPPSLPPPPPPSLPPSLPPPAALARRSHWNPYAYRMRSFTSSPAACQPINDGHHAVCGHGTFVRTDGAAWARPACVALPTACATRVDDALRLLGRDPVPRNLPLYGPNGVHRCTDAVMHEWFLWYAKRDLWAVLHDEDDSVRLREVLRRPLPMVHEYVACVVEPFLWEEQYLNDSCWRALHELVAHCQEGLLASIIQCMGEGLVLWMCNDNANIVRVLKAMLVRGGQACTPIMDVLTRHARDLAQHRSGVAILRFVFDRTINNDVRGLVAELRSHTHTLQRSGLNRSVTEAMRRQRERELRPLNRSAAAAAAAAAAAVA